MVGEVQAQLKQAACDPKKNVRLAAYEAAVHLMTNLEFSNVQKHEGYFVQLLLQGVTDEDQAARQFCLENLESFSEKMEHTLSELSKHEQQITGGGLDS